MPRTIRSQTMAAIVAHRQNMTSRAGLLSPGDDVVPTSLLRPLARTECIRRRHRFVRGCGSRDAQRCECTRPSREHESAYPLERLAIGKHRVAARAARVADLRTSSAASCDFCRRARSLRASTSTFAPRYVLAQRLRDVLALARRTTRRAFDCRKPQAYAQPSQHPFAR